MEEQQMLRALKAISLVVKAKNDTKYRGSVLRVVDQILTLALMGNVATDEVPNPRETLQAKMNSLKALTKEELFGDSFGRINSQVLSPAIYRSNLEDFIRNVALLTTSAAWAHQNGIDLSSNSKIQGFMNSLAYRLEVLDQGFDAFQPQTSHQHVERQDEEENNDEEEKEEGVELSGSSSVGGSSSSRTEEVEEVEEEAEMQSSDSSSVGSSSTSATDEESSSSNSASKEDNDEQQEEGSSNSSSKSENVSSLSASPSEEDNEDEQEGCVPEQSGIIEVGSI